MKKEQIKELLLTDEGILALQEAIDELPFRVTPKGFMENQFGEKSYDKLRECAQSIIGEPSHNGVPAIILTDNGGEWTEMALDLNGAFEV